MGFTNFPNGLTSFGVPVLPGLNGVTAFKRVFFVDKTYGNDNNNGLGSTADSAFASIQKALDSVRDSDVIIVMTAATYDEELQTGLCPGRPSLVPDGPPGTGRYVTLIGASNTNWAFDSPQIYNTSDGDAGIWVRSTGFRLSGFRIVGDSGSPICVKTGCNQAGADVGTEWAAGFQMDNCVLYGAVDANSGLELRASIDVRILNNMFDGFPTTGKGAIVQSGGTHFTFIKGHIMGNLFTNCKDNIVVGFGSTIISHNILSDNYTNPITRGIVLTSGRDNTVTMNVLGGATYDGTLYIAASGDNWSGNITSHSASANIASDTPWTSDLPSST